MLVPWTLNRAGSGVPEQTISAAQVTDPARLIATVRVPVNPEKVSVPKSRSWSFNNETGLTTLTEALIDSCAAAAGCAMAPSKSSAPKRTMLRITSLTLLQKR